MDKIIASFFLFILVAVFVFPPTILAQSSDIKEYKVKYINNGKIKLSHGRLSRIFDLSDHISGCQGNLYDSLSQKTIKSTPSVGFVSIWKKSKITTLLISVTLPSNCNVQGNCGAGTNTDFIALSVSDKLDKVFINSFLFENCYSGRYSTYKKEKNIIKIEFDESNGSKIVIFDMDDPSKGFIEESTLPK